MSQRVNPAHCITVAPGLTRHLAGGRIGIAESVLREVDVKRGRGDATALTYPQSLNQRPVRGSKRGDAIGCFWRIQVAKT